ncbi:MAG: DUF1700 domain-containing protein [Butyrivibrio sp.]|nr:DUF1700 domain-containing protein [Acetatifactor muris]MCM1560918.1 DUF1700 domain-containing protein [Butyrivibrio sp.]
MMEKQEFLDKLRLALNGRVSADILSDTLTYYEDYINAEVRKGRSEEEVMEMLGDPRLIARTIIETKGGETVETAREYAGDGQVERRHPSVPGWVWLIAVLVITVAVISVVFKIISVFFPVILIILLVSFLVKFFRDRAN